MRQSDFTILGIGVDGMAAEIKPGRVCQLSGGEKKE